MFVFSWKISYSSKYRRIEIPMENSKSLGGKVPRKLTQVLMEKDLSFKLRLYSKIEHTRAKTLKGVKTSERTQILISIMRISLQKCVPESLK